MTSGTSWPPGAKKANDVFLPLLVFKSSSPCLFASLGLENFPVFNADGEIPAVGRTGPWPWLGFERSGRVCLDSPKGSEMDGQLCQSAFLQDLAAV